METDRTTNDETGEPWDFTKKSQRDKARTQIQETQPWLVIGSPPCTMPSCLQNLNKGKVDPDRYRKSLVEAKTHLEFSAEIYQMQIDEGRYFLHEHPTTASSWRYDCMQRLIVNPYVGSIVFHMCQYGMMQKDDDGIEKHVKKPTRWLSNSPYVLNELDKRCEGLHDHVQLLGGKAKAAQVYPVMLCAAILQGLKKQLQCDGVIPE